MLEKVRTLYTLLTYDTFLGNMCSKILRNYHNYRTTLSPHLVVKCSSQWT